jgi:Zn finger protein HypA/HybF involved in hydrogenase expression
MQIAILIFLIAVLGVWCGFTIRDVFQLWRADARCPHCGTLLLEDDTTDMNIYDDDICETVMVGHCPDCHKNYTWIIKYKKDSFKNLEEVD